MSLLLLKFPVVIAKVVMTRYMLWFCFVLMIIQAHKTSSSSVDLLDTWTKSTALPSSLNWWAVTTSLDGQYKTAGSLASSSTSTPGYFFISNDSGKSWSESNDNWSFYAAVTDFTGQYLLGAENPDGIFLSSDFGYSFTRTIAPVSKWYNLAINSNGTIFYGASINDTIYRSLDSGNSWEAVSVTGNIQADEAGFYSVSCDSTGQYVMATTFYNSDYYQGVGKIYFSHDYGSTWNQSNTVTAGYISITSSHSGQIVYSAANLKGIYRSMDYGASFTKVNTMSSALNYFWVTTDISGENVITVVSNGRLYYSNNFGTSWTSSKDGATSGNQLWKRVACDGNGTSIIASISSSGIVIGDIVTVFPTPEPTFYPTYIATDSPTYSPTYNVSYIYIGAGDNNTSVPIFSFLVMLLIVCCCSISVAAYRVRYICVYYWYRCTGQTPPSYYSGALPTHDDDIGYAAATIAASHPQAEVEIVDPSGNGGTTASGKPVVTAAAVIIDDQDSTDLPTANMPVARGATEIPSAYPEPVPVVTIGQAEVIESYSGVNNAPRANRRTIGSAGNHPTPPPVHSITGSHGHHRARSQPTQEPDRGHHGHGQRRTRGGGGNSSALTTTDHLEV